MTSSTTVSFSINHNVDIVIIMQMFLTRSIFNANMMPQFEENCLTTCMCGVCRPQWNIISVGDVVHKVFVRL